VAILFFRQTQIVKGGVTPVPKQKGKGGIKNLAMLHLDRDPHEIFTCDVSKDENPFTKSENQRLRAVIEK